MGLTERERQILRLNAKGLSDYQIARKLKMDPPSVYRTRKTALKKLASAQTDISFAKNLGLNDF